MASEEKLFNIQADCCVVGMGYQTPRVVGPLVFTLSFAFMVADNNLSSLDLLKQILISRSFSFDAEHKRILRRIAIVQKTYPCV